MPKCTEMVDESEVSLGETLTTTYLSPLVSLCRVAADLMLRWIVSIFVMFCQQGRNEHINVLSELQQ